MKDVVSLLLILLGLTGFTISWAEKRLGIHYQNPWVKAIHFLIIAAWGGMFGALIAIIVIAL